MSEEITALKRILDRERAARRAAEQIIEQKSREIFLKNEELEELNGSLETKVEERTREIEESRNELLVSKEKAERADRAKSDFLSTVSHEFRTPLNGIIGLSELMSREVTDPDLNEKLLHIRNSGENLLHLINEILDFSKIEAGRITLDLIPFSLVELIESIRLSFAYRMTEKGLEFPIVVEDNLPDQLIGDSHKIRQILNNLVGNAIKFTNEGKIALTVKVVSSESQKLTLSFAVSDTGIGIPAEKQNAVFEAFEQAESSTTRLYGGTGLGLSIVKRFALLMNGQVTLTSEPGTGSIFELIIPLGISKENLETKSQLLEVDDTLISHLKVLLVDDQPVNRFLMAQVFKKKGINATLVENGMMAIEALQKNDFDLVFMDLHMPGIDGYQTVNKIRTGEAGDQNKNLYVVALTADVQEDIREKVIEKGMNDYLSKPIRMDEVYNRLQAAAHILIKGE